MNRFIEEKIFRVLMIAATALIVCGLLLILGSIFYKGFSALSWDMISKPSSGGYYFGKEGGILNAIIGSTYLAFLSTLLAVLLGIPVVLYLNAYDQKRSWFKSMLRLFFDILWGIPSIVYGAFGFILMIYLGIKASLFAAIIIVTLVIFPVIIRSVDEVLKLVPKGLYEAGYSLGATKTETAFRIILKQIYPGIITAVLIAFGRAIGDAAAVLFTAGYTDFIPTSIFQAAATLPLAIFFQLSTPFPEVQERAYASALILTVIILITSLLSRYLTQRFNKYKI